MPTNDFSAKYLRLILSFALLSGVISCKNSYEPLLFKDIQNIQLSKIKNGIVEMKAEAILYNPNKVKAKLKEIDIDVYIKDKKVASMKESYSLKIESFSEFSLPINIRLDFSERSLINFLLGFIQGKQVDVRYTGKAEVIIYGASISLPINYNNSIRL